MRNKALSLLINLILILIAFIVSRTFAQMFFLFLTVTKSNIQIIGTSLAFDPLITIAYILVFYFITLFYQPRPKAQYLLFLMTLYLSFTTGFVEGSIFMVALYFSLRRLKLM